MYLVIIHDEIDSKCILHALKFQITQLTHEEFAHEVMSVCFGLNQEFDIISNDIVTK